MQHYQRKAVALFFSIEQSFVSTNQDGILMAPSGHYRKDYNLHELTCLKKMEPKTQQNNQGPSPNLLQVWGHEHPTARKL